MTNDRVRIGNPALALAALAGAAIVILPTCRSTEHTVARIVTPTPAPAEVFVPEPAAPASPPPAAPATWTPAVPSTPTPSPTVVGMPVVTAPPRSGDERSPGVLYEEMVPTAAAVTRIETPAATRTPTPRPTRTPTSGPTRRPGVYYEDPEGRPVPTATPSL